MCRPQSSRHIPCAVHLEFRQTLDRERHGGACRYFCRLRHGGACLLLWLAAARRSVPATLVGCAYDILLLVFAFRSMIGWKQSDIFEFDPHRLASVKLQRDDSFL